MLYILLCGDPHILEEADNGSMVVVWNRKEYLRGANNQLSDKDVYRQVKRDVKDLMKIIKKAIGKVRDKGNISDETLDYFLANNPISGISLFLPKIQKALHNVPGRPVMPNCQAIILKYFSFY